MKRSKKPTTKGKTTARKKMPPIGSPGRLGLDWGLIVSLGAVGALWPLIHDLPTFADAVILQIMVAIGVLAVIVSVPILLKVPRPLATLVCVGGVCGILSVLVHQVMWRKVFPSGAPPLEPGATYQPPETVLRLFASISAFITSVIIGTFLGLVALTISKFTYSKK